MRAGTRIAEETLDELADDLMRLRERTGATSYAEIARRITVRRVADGELPDGAMIPRSTVYHAFSKGRTRIDAELVRDIALALGESAERADDWVRRCGSARKRAPELRVPEAVDTAPVALAAIPAEHGGGAARRAAPPAAT
ncbi:hypothetical protein, partial [Leucobacter chromiireducens]|uniref:hypothetical protein n=1 Tax=Leucobacter chromiireducens TaxID=283877 RepID=UPI0019D20A6C